MNEKNKHDISDTIRNREDDVLNVPRIIDDRDVNVFNNIQVQQVPSSATANLMSTIDIDELIAKFSRQGYYLRNKRNKYKTEWKNSIEDAERKIAYRDEVIYKLRKRIYLLQIEKQLTSDGIKKKYVTRRSNNKIHQQAEIINKLRIRIEELEGMLYTPIYRPGDKVIVLNDYHPSLLNKTVTIDKIEGKYAVFSVKVGEKKITTKRAFNNIRKV